MQKKIVYDNGEYIINYHIEYGNNHNRLPLNRKHLIISHNSGNIIVEDMWDLLQTVNHNTTFTHDSSIIDHVLCCDDSLFLAVYNGKQCMIANRELDNVYICAIWYVDTDDTDFIIQPKINDSISRVLISDNVIERYGSSITDARWHHTL